MGLTIHFHLKTSLTEPTDVRTLVESLRQVGCDLPIKEVGELVEFTGTSCDFEQCDSEDKFRWLKIQAQGTLDEPDHYVRVKPSHIIAFTSWPGEGCEEANFGFCKFPAYVDTSSRSGPTWRLATRLDGWRWGSCCKTQYASDPDCGGIENFLRCHLAIVKLLDFAKTTGLITVDVDDEGGYWEQRSLDGLTREIGRQNEFIAAMTGMVKDALDSNGLTVEAPISGFAAFEHLEAKGMERLKDLRSRTKPSDG